MITQLDMFRIVLMAAFGSLLASLLIVATERWHGRHSLDSDMNGAQKFHKRPVPRVGGLSLVAGLMTVIAFGLGEFPSGAGNDLSAAALLLLLAGLPAYLAGSVEDLTKRVSVGARLMASFASALLACWLLGATLPRLNVWGIDLLLQITPLAMIVTAFCVAGVANSINIIDGFNGLAGITAIILMAGIGFVAWQADDVLMVELAMTGIGATIGFLCLNYPTGRLFLGDGGAYLLGFWIAEVAVLTVARNPSVNAWQVLAICAYPIIEVLFSIYRRKVMQKANVGAPDRLHLHSLVYRRLVCQHLWGKGSQPWARNATVACIMTIWIAPASALAVFLGDTIGGALTVIVVQLFSYLAFYARLVRGRWCFNPVIVFGLRPQHRAKSV